MPTTTGPPRRELRQTTPCKTTRSVAHLDVVLVVETVQLVEKLKHRTLNLFLTARSANERFINETEFRFVQLMSITESKSNQMPRHYAGVLNTTIVKLNMNISMALHTRTHLYLGKGNIELAAISKLDLSSHSDTVHKRFNNMLWNSVRPRNHSIARTRTRTQTRTRVRACTNT